MCVCVYEFVYMSTDVCVSVHEGACLHKSVWCVLAGRDLGRGEVGGGAVGGWGGGGCAPFESFSMCTHACQPI